MASHALTVCVFCLICATHSPCGSHAAVAHEQPQIYSPLNELSPSSIRNTAKEKFKLALDLSATRIINKRNSDNFIDSDNNKDYFLNKLLTVYGNGEVINPDGYDKLLKDLQSMQSHNQHVKRNTTCYNGGSKAGTNITRQTLDGACPELLYSIISPACDQHEHGDDQSGGTFQVWMYSICSVVAISACGILALFIVPIMNKKYYKPLLQFFVALAVGTLAGDALLHLLPHAMSSGHDHGESEENVWKGFVAMLGLIGFFVMERFIPLIHRCRKTRPAKQRAMQVVHTDDLEVPQGDTQCMDRYNATRRCFKDIVDDPKTTYLSQNNKKKCSPNGLTDDHNLDANSTKDQPIETNQNQTECLNDLSASHNCTEVNKMLPQIETSSSSHEENDYRVILAEHGAVVHHGHSHVHGHVHSAPENFSSVAWMVIMGDGLHNFTDGMAIGAAFSGSIAGGFSTTLAVLCHELPHEIGDFAMLLKAGMTVRQAFFYNIISSVLCILGNLLGIWLGNTDYASSWVFAVAAGTFIYIALVDMIPELTSAHEDESNLLQCALHLSGLLLGFALMTLIALYEHDLKNIFVV